MQQHKKQSPPPAMRGHQWPAYPANGDAPGVPAITPALVSAMELRMQPRKAIGHFCYDVWAVDAEDSTGSHYRVGTGRWRRRSADQVHIYAPNIHFAEDERKHPRRFITSRFLLVRGLEHLLPFTTIAQKGYLILDDPDESIRRLIIAMVAVGQRSGDVGFAEAQSLLWQWIAAVQHATVLRPAQSTRHASAKTDGLVARVDRFLRRNLADSSTLADMARELGVPTSTLSHAYQRATGRSPMATRMQMRIEAAAPLIHQGMPLHEVARRTGFADAFYLSRCFRKTMGCSPREYRMNAGEDR